MKTRILCLVGLAAGIAGITAVGCTIQDTSDSTCSGFLGCSSRQPAAIGIAATDTGAAGTGAAAGTGGGGGAAGTGMPIGRPATGINAIVPGAGCGKDLPAGQVRAK